MQAVSLFWILIVPTTAFRVKVSPQKAVRHVGDALKLTCTQTVCPDDQLTWGTATDIPLFGNLKDKEYVINNLTLGHNIRIYCKAFCQNEKGQGSAEIKVYPFPEGPEISGTEGLRVGEEKSINCSLRAVARDYKVDIEWLLGNKVLHRYTDLNKSDSEDTRNVYSVYKLNTSVQDNGETLTCRANLSLESNNRLVGESSRRLTVSYAPVNLITSVTGQADLQTGHNFELTCNAEGNPNPEVVWMRAGQNKVQPTQTFNGTLVIQNASWFHAGEYLCLARNAIGYDNSSVNLTVRGPPDAPVITLSSESDPREGDNLTISCQANGGPTLSVVIIRHLDELKNVTWRKLPVASTYIPSIQLRDSGLYHCVANNSFGSKISSINVTVKETYHRDPSPNTPDLPKIVVPAVVSIPLISAVALLVRFLRRAKRGSPDITPLDMALGI